MSPPLDGVAEGQAVAVAVAVVVVYEQVGPHLQAEM